MTTEAKAIAALVLLLALNLLAGACVVKGYQMGIEHQQAKDSAVAAAAQAGKDQAMNAAAEALQAMAQPQAKIIERVTHETTKIPVYSTCVNDAGVMRDINAALTNAKPAGDQPMPAASAPQ